MRKSVTMRAIAFAVLGSSAVLIGGLALSGSPVKVRAAEAVKPAVKVRKPAPAPVAAPPVVAAPVMAVAEPAEGYVVKRVLDVPEPLRHGDYYWDTAGVPEGPIVITVDLVAQTLSIFRAGYEIGTAAVIYGADEKPTPLGVFKITQKDAHHVSNLYGAPMPYMMRLTNDGVSIHGSKLMDGKYATHGCVGVPTAFAKLIFEQVKLGDRVIVTSGEMLQRGGRITAA
jgi:lipoprotein-anchoring transpeptidase ErfK/SrfK